MLELGLSCFSDSYNTHGNIYTRNVPAHRRLVRVRVPLRGKDRKVRYEPRLGFWFPASG